MINRKSLLESLITLDKPLSEIQIALDRFDWAWQGDYLVTQTRQQIISVLQRFLNKKLSAKDVQDWAFLLDGREDIDNELGYNDIIVEVIQTLALEPDQGSPLTTEKAIKLIEALESAQFNSNENKED